MLDVSLEFYAYIDTNLYSTFDFKYICYHQIYIYNHMKYVLLTFLIHLFLLS